MIHDGFCPDRGFAQFLNFLLQYLRINIIRVFVCSVHWPVVSVYLVVTTVDEVFWRIQVNHVFHNNQVISGDFGQRRKRRARYRIGGFDQPADGLVARVYVGNPTAGVPH